MLLEKLKEHSGKVMFFVMNALIVTVGVLFIKQQNEDKTKEAVAQVDLQNYKSAVDYALDAQKQIMSDKALKMNSVASNPDTVARQQGVQVTKTIPAVTKTVTVQQPAASSSTPAPKKTTKTS